MDREPIEQIEQIEQIVRATMPKPFHGPAGMAACADIAQGGGKYLRFADRTGGPLQRALAGWADRFGAPKAACVG